MSLTSLSSFLTEISMSGYGDGRSASSSDAIYRRILLFVYGLNHSSLYLFLSREHDDDVTDIGKHHFRSGLRHLILSNANPSKGEYYFYFR